eukprot:s10409_g2.t1
MRSLSSLTRTLERKLDSLRTRLSIMKLAPEIQFPTENGVTMILNTLENELRQASADETVRLNKQQSNSEDVPTAAKGKGKGKEADKGKGKGKGKGKESKGKQGKTNNGSAGTGSGGKTESSDRRKELPCHFHWSPAGCYRKSCPYSHAEKHKPKPNNAASAQAPPLPNNAAATQAPALVGGGGAETSSAAQAAAKPKAKPKPNPKASSVTTFTSLAMMAMRSGGFEREDSESSDADSLSEVSEGSLDSEDSTVGILMSHPPEDDFEEAFIGALEHARLEAQEPLCYLILDHDEYIRWRQPQMVNGRALLRSSRGQHLCDCGFDAPEWSASPAPCPDNSAVPRDRLPFKGWQRLAAHACDKRAYEMHLSDLTPASRALLLSQAGPFAARAFDVTPTRRTLPYPAPFAAQRAFAASLQLPPAAELGEGPEPELHELLAEARWDAA